MHTRQDYLDGKCTHREYYAQFVTLAIKEAVVRRWGKEQITGAFKADEHLNSIPLASWDDFVLRRRQEIENQIRLAGDFWSLAGGVCVAKEAARQIAEGK